MPEGVAAAVADEHAGGDRGPQRGGQAGIIRPGHRGQQRVLGARAAHGGGPQHFLGRLGQVLHRGQQQVPQQPRQPRSERAIRIHQGLGEQRDPAAALEHGISGRRSGRVTEDARQLCGHLVARQPGQLQPDGSAHPAQPGQQRPQQGVPVQLIGTERDNQQHGGLPQVAGQEAQQVTRRAIGPVHILHYQDHGPLLSKSLQQREQQLEQPRPGGFRVGSLGRSAEARQQHGQLASGVPGKQRGHLRGTPVTGQLPHRCRERRIRHAGRTQLHTAPGQHQRPIPHPRGELGTQPRLAAPRLRAKQHNARLPARSGLERAGQLGQLGLTPHENRAHHAPGHVPIMPTAPSAAGRRYVIFTIRPALT